MVCADPVALAASVIELTEAIQADGEPTVSEVIDSYRKAWRHRSRLTKVIRRVGGLILARLVPRDQ
jgi:hypothetical protein